MDHEAVRRPRGWRAVAIAVVVLVGLMAFPATTGADQVHLELASVEQLELPGGYWADPGSVNDAGTVVGQSSPSGVAVTWESGATTGFAGRPDGSVAAELVAVGGDDVAFGMLAFGAPPTRRPVSFDVTSGVWSYLPVPDGWIGSVFQIGEDGSLLGAVGPEGTDMPYAAVWVDPSEPPRVAPIVGSGRQITPSGRVLVVADNGAIATWWDPSTGDLEPIEPPVAGSVIEGNDAGQYVILTGGDGGLLWDSRRDVRTFVSGVGSLRYPYRSLAATGVALARIDSRWYLVDAATGERSPMRPFDLDVPASQIHPTAFDGARVLGTVADGSTSRVFVWSAGEHTVDIGPADGPDAFVPTCLADGVVAGVFENPTKGLWRATFRLAPNAPEELDGEVEGASVALAWEPPSADGDAPIEAYLVKADGAEVARVAAGSTSWSGTAEGEAAYTVVAVNAYGESTPSNAVVLAATATSTASAVEVTPAFTG